MSRSFRLQVANTFLLLVVGLLVVVNGTNLGSMEYALRWTVYGVGVLVIIFAFREILGARRADGDDAQPVEGPEAEAAAGADE